MLRTWVGSQAPPTPHLRTSVRWVGLVPGNAKKPLTVPGLQPPFPPKTGTQVCVYLLPGGFTSPSSGGKSSCYYHVKSGMLLPCDR